MTGNFRSAFVCLLVIAVVLCGPGCPRTANSPTGSIKQGKVTVLIGSASKALGQALLEAVAPKSVVAADEIYSLTLTVTEISLSSDDDADDEHGDDEGDDDHGDDEGDDGDDDKHHDADHDGGTGHGDGDDDGDDEHGDDDSDNDNGEHDDEDDDKVVIFQGSQDIDLVSLDNLSQVFSMTDIPAGVYHRITLNIENPRLRLVSDPETEITGIHLTANGRLFVNTTFEVPEGGNSLIELMFNGVHLVRLGNGGYVLTPQLDASVTVTAADISATGAIASVDDVSDSLVLTLAEGDATVLYGGAAIFLTTDTDTATGTETDLVPGASVEIVGTIDADGVITATEIRLL